MQIKVGGEGLADKKKLIRKAQKGDVSAFEEIISEYQAIVYNVAYRYTDNSEDAADMSQEIFLKMFKNINSFQFKSKLSTWIYRVATNTCLDYAKKQKRSVSGYSIDIGYEDQDGNVVSNDIVDESPTPDAVLEKSERIDVINQAISKLPDDYKTVVILRDIHGLPYDEIAEIIDCSVGTVKSRISRGRRTLRENLLKDRELFEKYFV